MAITLNGSLLPFQRLMEYKKIMASDHSHYHGPPDYRFCPRCSGQLENRKIKDGEPERLICGKCTFVFYLDPKLAAGTIFTLDGRVVLLRRGVEPAVDRWVFPGGYVDRGESVPDAAVRETKEESNLDVRLSSLLNVYSYPGSPVVVVVYAAEIIGGRLEARDESVEAKVFSPADIPWEELAFQSTRDALKDYLRLYPGQKF